MSNPRRWRSADLLSAADEEQLPDTLEDQYKKTPVSLSKYSASTIHLPTNGVEAVVNFRAVLRNKVQPRGKQTRKFESEKPSWTNRSKSINMDVLEKRNKNFSVNTTTPAWSSVLRKSTTDLSKIGSKQNGVDQVDNKPEMKLNQSLLKKTPKNEKQVIKAKTNVNNSVILRPRKVEIEIDENNNELPDNKSITTETQMSNKTKSALRHNTSNGIIQKSNPNEEVKINSTEESNYSKKATNAAEIHKSKTKFEKKSVNNSEDRNSVERENVKKSFDTKEEKHTTEESTNNINSLENERKSSSTKSAIQRRISQLSESPTTNTRRTSSEKIGFPKGKSLQDRKMSLTSGSANRKRNSLTDKNYVTDVLRKKSVEIDIKVDVKLNKNVTNSHIGKDEKGATKDIKKVDHSLQKRNSSENILTEETAPESGASEKEINKEIKKSKVDVPDTVSKANDSGKIPEAKQISEIMRKLSLKTNNEQDELDITEAAKEIATRQQRFKALKLNEEERKQRRHRESRRSKKQQNIAENSKGENKQFEGSETKTVSTNNDDSAKQIELNDSRVDENNAININSRKSTTEVKSGDIKSSTEIQDGDNESNAETNNGGIDSNAVITNGDIDSNAETKNGDIGTNAEITNGDIESNAENKNGIIETKSRKSIAEIRPKRYVTEPRETESSKKYFVNNKLNLTVTKGESHELKLDNNNNESDVIETEKSEAKPMVIKARKISNETTDLKSANSSKSGVPESAIENDVILESNNKDETTNGTLSSMESLSQRIRRRQRQPTQEEDTEIDFAARRRARRAKRLEEESSLF